MLFEEFSIGMEFWCAGRRWRCTDKGTRVVVAIRVDEVAMTTLHENGTKTTRTIDGREAERTGLFNGPPYGVAESVFDEYEIEGCSLDPDEDEA